MTRTLDLRGWPQVFYVSEVELIVPPEIVEYIEKPIEDKTGQFDLGFHPKALVLDLALIGFVALAVGFSSEAVIRRREHKRLL